jgi:hypothetical protein
VVGEGSWLIRISSLGECKATPMMESKEQHVASLINATLEDLVPANHFYRHLE